MTRKGLALFATDVINGLILLSLVSTAAILRWVLPPGLALGAVHISDGAFAAGAD